MGLAFVAMFASAPGQSFLIAVFVDEILTDTGLSRTAFSVLYGVATVGSATWVLAAGRLADHLGLRFVWIAAALGLAGACGVVSVATGAVLLLIALTMLRAFGQGTFPLVATLIVAVSFGERRGRAMAMASYGLMLAGAVLPPAVALLIVAAGWRSAYQLIGLGLLLLALPLALRVPGRTVAAADRAPFWRRGGARPRRPGLWILLLVLAMPPLVMTGVTFHSVSIFDERGVSLTGAGLALTALAVAGAATTLVCGAIADRATTSRLLLAMSAPVALSMLALAEGSALGAYAAFGFLGVASGVYPVANGVVFARAYGTKSLGDVQGLAASTQIGAAAIGPVPLAAAHSLTGAYLSAVAGFLMLSVACSVLGARSRSTRVTAPSL